MRSLPNIFLNLKPKQMAKQVFQLSIDVNKIDKARLFKGKKGTYLTAALILKDEPDQYGNIGMIVESISKEEREAGHQGTIIGNAKSIEKPHSDSALPKRNEVTEIEFSDGLPF
jgi:hypothetical protein